MKPEKGNKMDVSIPEEIECWEIVERPINETVLYRKFELMIKRDVKGEVWKPKACLVVCGNKRVNYCEEMFSPVAHCIVIKLIFSLRIRRGWLARHIDFDNVVLKGRRERPVYA